MKRYLIRAEDIRMKPKKKRKGKVPDNRIIPFLQHFWKRAGRREIHLDLLREFTEIFVTFNPVLYERYRKKRAAALIRANEYECFVCAGQAVLGHHIIELQHGGTNLRANIVPLCEACHQTVHPWMASPEMSEKDRPFWA